MRLFKKKIPPKDELYLKDIVKTYLENDKVKIKHSPSTGEYFLIDEEKQVTLLIKIGVVEVSNHKYFYKRTVSIKFSDELVKMINKKIKEDTEQLKKELFHNEIDFLRMILKQ